MKQNKNANRRYFVLSVTLIFYTIIANAQTWTGASSTNWNTGSNWNTGVKPATTGNVIIPSSLARYPALVANVTINSIQMNPGSSLDFRGYILTTNGIFPNLSTLNNKIEGATLNNTTAGTDIKLNINTGDNFMGQPSLFNSNIVSGNIIFEISGLNDFYDGKDINTGNKYFGNATFIKYGVASIQNPLGDVYIGNQADSEFHKKLTFDNMAIGSNGGYIIANNIIFKGAEDSEFTTSSIPVVNLKNVTIEKSNLAKVILNSSIIARKIKFINGNFVTDIGKELVFTHIDSYSGASVNSYVDGPVIYAGSSGFVFPIGNGGKYAPLTISSFNFISPALDIFTAQYFKNTKTNLTNKDASLHHLSSAEYWTLNRDALGYATAFVTLGWDVTRSGSITDMSQLRIARWNGTVWKDEGNSATTGTNSSGTITSGARITNFSPFTFASATPANSFTEPSALPVSLISFSGKQVEEGNLLIWQTTNETNFSHFEIEKSENAKIFEKIGEIKAKGGLSEKVEYEFADIISSELITQTLNLCYYRLKMVDIDGKFSFSKIITIENQSQSEIAIYPNPTFDFLSINQNDKITTLEIIDFSGKIIKKYTQNKDNKYNVKDLSSGIYFVKMEVNNTTVIKKIVVK